LKGKGEKMKDYLSKAKYETIKKMTVISGTRISAEPEEEIIGIMTKFKNDNGIVVKRTFGHDSPVNEENTIKGYRGYEYLMVVDEDDVIELVKDTEFVLKKIPSIKYASLRITDPFVDPFDRIPNGWNTLVKWLEENNVTCNLENKDNLECLEDVREENGAIFMDIYIPVEKA